MSVVLVVEPETAQANLLKKMQKRLGAQVVVVKTTADAIDAIDRAMPDVILLSALLSPRDEDRLMTHLRSLEGASHLQTLTIPQLRTEKAADTAGGKKGFFGKKRATAAPGKCDPAVFAEEISAQLQRAADLRSRPSSGAFPILMNAPVPPALAPQPAAIIQEPATFADPWVAERFIAAPVNLEPQIEPVVGLPPSVFETPILSAADEPMTFADPWASERFTAAPANAESVFEPLEPPSVFDTPILDTADEPVTVADPWVSEPVVNTADSAIEELDRLARELGLSLESGLVDVQNEESAERMAAEVALVQAETEAKLAAELERVRAEAEERRLTELARLQAGADAAREAAIADARAAAEEETRRALASEVARVRSEAEGTVAEAVNRVRIEAERTLSQEIGRARQDSDALRADLTRVQDEATETARTLEAEVAQVRAQADAHLRAELERIGKDAERARAADRSHAKETAEQIREAAAREARAIAEEAARLTLNAEIARVRSQADTILETEIARVRAETQERQAVQLLELRSQMAEMRQAATEQAREAAEEARAAAEQARAVSARQAATERAREAAEEARAVAEQARAASARQAAADQAREAAEEARAVAEQVRAAAARRPAEVISFPAADAPPPMLIARPQQPLRLQAEPPLRLQQQAALRLERPAEVAEVEVAAAQFSGERRDYYSLWQKITHRGDATETEDQQGADEEAAPFNYARWIKWGLPVAAALVVVVMNGMDTVARLAPATAEPAPKRTVTEVRRREVAAPPAKVGTLRVETTPAGAQITLDGESRGESPQTIPNLKPGSHNLVLHSGSGTIVRRVTVRVGQTTLASEAIFSGWLALFAPIKLDIKLNGATVAPMEDGRFMIAPGTYQVEMVNARYNFRKHETLVVKPGQVTAHTVSLPTGTLKISVPDGTDVSVDGQPIGKAPFAELLPLVVGTHEITASHPDRGERRTAVDVKFEQTTEAKLPF